MQFAGEFPAIRATRSVDLAEQDGGGLLEFGETSAPAGAQFGRHAVLDEGPAHRRRVGLKRTQFFDIFIRQAVGNGGEQLRHLHQRPLKPAERTPQLGCIARRITGMPR